MILSAKVQGKCPVEWINDLVRIIKEKEKVNETRKLQISTYLKSSK